MVRRRSTVRFRNGAPHFWADAGDQATTEQLANLLASQDDIGGLRACARVGDETAAGQLTYLLASRGDIERLRGRTAAGDSTSALSVAKMVTERGDFSDAATLLQSLADGGNEKADK